MYLIGNTIMGFIHCIRMTFDARYRDNFLKQKKRHIMAIRHWEIMNDSFSILKQTVSPKTFFGRYDDAVSNAQKVINLYDDAPFAENAKEIYSVLVDEKADLCNDFLCRCNDIEGLGVVKAYVDEHPCCLPKESMAFLENLLKLTEENDDFEYFFCSVVFDSEKSFYYLSDIDNIKIGDKVLVPVGVENEPKIATVVKTEKFKISNAPYPVRKLKYIINVV